MTAPQPNSFRTGPDERGHFGIYGGRFVAETLMPLILDLEKAYAAAKADPKFQSEMDGHLANYVGRPSPLYFAERSDLSPIRIYAKVADRLIFDARAPETATRPGGLGQPFDWMLLKGVDPGVPFMLSGGLDADNVAEALRITNAPGVDVSSGVERAPGEKDPDKIRAFVRAARAAEAALTKVSA